MGTRALAMGWSRIIRALVAGNPSALPCSVFLSEEGRARGHRDSEKETTMDWTELDEVSGHS